MIYIIISNIGLAIVTIIMFVRYSHFRISSNLKLKDLEKGVAAEKSAKIEIETKLRAEAKAEIEQVKKLLREIEQVRKERQEEVKLRLEAEKQIELAFQKMKEIQKRMADWKSLQTASALDAKETLERIGNELFLKISQGKKEELSQNRATLDQATKGIYDKLEKMSAAFEDLKNIRASNVAQIPVPASVDVVNAETTVKSPIVKTDEDAKSAAQEVISLAKVSGFKAKKNYILPTDFDKEKAKFVVCDVALLVEKTLYLVDFKSIRFLKKYDEAQDKTAISAATKANLDKYLAYISNPKYMAAVKKIASSLKMDFTEVKVVFGVKNLDEIKGLKDLKFNDKVAKMGIEILDINGVNDLIL